MSILLSKPLFNSYRSASLKVNKRMNEWHFSHIFFCLYQFVCWEPRFLHCVMLLVSDEKYEQYICFLPAEYLNWTTLFKSPNTPPSSITMFSASNMQIVTCSLYAIVFVIALTKYWVTSFLISLWESETQARDKKLGYQLGYLVFSFSLTLTGLLFIFLVLLITALTFQYMKGSMRWKGKEEQLVYLLSFIIAICRMQRKYI